MFIEGISGTLMRVEKSNQTRFGFMIWFPYTRGSMNKIREGSLVLTKNFSNNKTEEHYSVMRITSVLPSHYALGTKQDGYPGFVEEAAINAAKDWEQERPIEDTTKIVCDAVPTTFEITMPSRIMGNNDVEPEIVPESNMPMIGEKVRMLDEHWTQRIVNHDLQKLKDEVIILGKLANSDSVDIMVLWDSLIRTHFGVFAYTNAGKSNLLSTLTSKVLGKSADAKIVIYDLMGEYGALLVDVLYDNPNACIICLSPDAVPKSVLRYWRSCSDEDLQKAAEDIVNTTILPKMLKSRQHDFKEPVREIIRNGKIRVLSPEEKLGSVINEVVYSTEARSSGDLIIFREQVNDIADTQPFTTDTINNTINQINGINVGKTQGPGILKKALIKRLEVEKRNLEVFEKIKPTFLIKFNDIVNSLNTQGSGLYIIQDSDDGTVRKMSDRLGRMTLEQRRAKGIISPPISFIYDEADQFIAQDDRGQEHMKNSKRMAEQLARRGRKYGLGIGIATQRIVYLDTNILGQPHTYFVSKLPRASDREKIQEAFGLSDDTLRESLRFGVGQWLLISHSATGIDGLPIPIQFEDANERIKRFLDSLRTTP